MNDRTILPHPANVPGDFYVEDGCCTMCEVPFGEAPELFGVDDRPESYVHCYVKRQPETPEQFEHMLMAIRCAELRCIRYRGHDRLVQLRLVESGNGSECDILPEDLRQRSEEVERQNELDRKKRRSTIWGRLKHWFGTYRIW